jgi:hypothetical protein
MQLLEKFFPHYLTPDVVYDLNRLFIGKHTSYRGISWDPAQAHPDAFEPAQYISMLLRYEFPSTVNLHLSTQPWHVETPAWAVYASMPVEWSISNSNLYFQDRIVAFLDAENSFGNFPILGLAPFAHIGGSGVLFFAYMGVEHQLQLAADELKTAHCNFRKYNADRLKAIEEKLINNSNWGSGHGYFDEKECVTFPVGFHPTRQTIINKPTIVPHQTVSVQGDAVRKYGFTEALRRVKVGVDSNPIGDNIVLVPKPRSKSSDPS